MSRLLEDWLDLLTRYDLAFLGRLTSEKGPEAAIRIARAVGMPLRIAAKVPRGDRSYFKERLEPQIDGKQVQITGEVNDETKQQFLAGAAALLFPIDWPEPFGLVMIEGNGLRHARYRIQVRFSAGSYRRRLNRLCCVGGSRSHPGRPTARRAQSTASAEAF